MAAEPSLSSAASGGTNDIERRNVLRFGTVAAGVAGTTTLLGLSAARASAVENAKGVTGMAPSGKDDRVNGYVTNDTFSAELGNKVAKGELIINAKDHGVRGDAARRKAAGSILAGSTRLRGLEFVPEDLGKYIAVAGAGQGGGTLATTISAVIDPTTISLATSASTSVANASYLYGTDDTSSIQLLLDGVDDRSYSQIFFPTGSYLTDGLRVKNNTQLLGAGRGAWAYEFYDRTTRFIAKPGTKALGLITDYAGEAVGNVRLTDLMLDGAKEFQTGSLTGIFMADSKISADSLWSIERVYVGFFPGDGAYLGAYRRANRVNDCHFWQCGGNGIRIDGTDNSFIQTVFAQNGGDGLLLNQGANHFYGCDIFSNAGHGANILPLGRMNQFTNCFFDANMKSGVFNAAKNLSLTQCRFCSNSQGQDGVFADIEIVGGAPGCSLINPAFYALPETKNLPHSGIRAVGNAGSNLVFLVGFSHDPNVQTWRTGSYVETTVGLLHKGFSLSDGAVITTGTTNGTIIGANSANKLGFFGSKPITRPQVGASAIDGPAALKLVNELRSRLIELGLLQ